MWFDFSYLQNSLNHHHLYQGIWHVLNMIERKCSLGSTYQDKSLDCQGNHQWPSSAQGNYCCHLHGTDRTVVAAIWLYQMAPVTESYSYRKNKVVSCGQGSIRHQISYQPIQMTCYTLITDTQTHLSSSKQAKDHIRQLWYVFFPCWINLKSTFWRMSVKGKSFHIWIFDHKILYYETNYTVNYLSYFGEIIYPLFTPNFLSENRIHHLSPVSRGWAVSGG